MLTPNLIPHLQTLIGAFCEQTEALGSVFTEDKKAAVWAVKYNVIKLEFVLIKKESILCPISTLFCRVYLGKNDVCFYHLPELMEFLEPENYKCYYFPYIESEKRMDACFRVLEAFLKKHLSAIQELAKSSPMSKKIKDAKLVDMATLFTTGAQETQQEQKLEIKTIVLGAEKPELELQPGIEDELLSSYERFVLLPRYLAEGPYRDFVLGNYDKSLKAYRKSLEKGQLTGYERRLVIFLEGLTSGYEALPKECETIRKVKAIDSPSQMGVSMILAALVMEVVFGMAYAGIVAVITAVLSEGTLYYAGMPWYCGFLFAGLPALFGGIAFRNMIRKRIQKENYEETIALEKLTNPPWVETLARSAFVLTLVGTLFINVCTSFMSARFYEDYMTYNDGEELLPIHTTTCKYADLENVYYSEGLYNDFGDYIARASYLLEFKDGTVWDSDGDASINEVEEHILPLMESYYDKINRVKARNEILQDIAE